MSILFSKYHGLGNDFIVIDAREQMDAYTIFSQNQLFIKQICDRHIGIGSDGLVLILNSHANSDIRMIIYNADGSEPEMCGNGIRCLVKYLFDQNIISTNELINIETKAGILKSSVDKSLNIEVNMGIPILDPINIPTTFELSSKGIVHDSITLDNNEFVFASVGMGNPHFIIFVDYLEKVKLHQWGPALETHREFPSRTNVHFVKVTSRNSLEVLVWERGAGATLACGTGACACVVAAILLDYTDDDVNVVLPGGRLNISWENKNGPINMKGPAKFVYSGSFDSNK